MASARGPRRLDRIFPHSGQSRRARSGRIRFPLTARSRMQPIISIEQLGKTYASGFQALKSIDLEIRRGEIFALLGPNGAGKTTLISIVCGIVNPGSGQVLVAGHDIVRDYRASRSEIVVPLVRPDGALLGVWDVDSPDLARFDEADRAGMEHLCAEFVRACA